MIASGCHTVRNRSQSPASRHSTQFSTTARISAASAIVLRRAGVSMPGPLASPRTLRLQDEIEARRAERRRDPEACRVSVISRVLDEPADQRLLHREYGIRPQMGIDRIEDMSRNRLISFGRHDEMYVRRTPAMAARRSQHAPHGAVGWNLIVDGSDCADAVAAF